MTKLNGKSTVPAYRLMWHAAGMVLAILLLLAGLAAYYDHKNEYLDAQRMADAARTQTMANALLELYADDSEASRKALSNPDIQRELRALMQGQLNAAVTEANRDMAANLPSEARQYRDIQNRAASAVEAGENVSARKDIMTWLTQLSREAGTRLYIGTLAGKTALTTTNPKAVAWILLSLAASLLLGVGLGLEMVAKRVGGDLRLVFGAAPLEATKENPSHG